MKCLYRNWSKCNNNFTQEHVLPQAIGGNINPVNPFSINNVCKSCNSLAGLYIDGPFIRSWYTQMDRARFGIKFLNLESKPVVPLSYWGVSEDFSYKDKICEIWLGPTGDTIFHFHEPYPEEQDKPYFIGIPPYIKEAKIDHGFTFLFMRSNNPIWHPVIINSYLAHFNKSINYFGNVKVSDRDVIKNVPNELTSLKEEIVTLLRGKKKLNMNFKTNEDFDSRFLGKLALGFGTLNLKKGFEDSKCADKLRALMWEKDSKKITSIGIRGGGFMKEKFNPQFKDTFSWPGGHFIAIIKYETGIALHIMLYEDKSAIIQITDDPDYLDVGNMDGFYYAVVPSLQRAVGPKRINEYFAHKVGRKDMELLALEEEMNKFNVLPPFDI